MPPEKTAFKLYLRLRAQTLRGFFNKLKKAEPFPAPLFHVLQTMDS
jgi:hypothetical protein